MSLLRKGRGGGCWVRCSWTPQAESSLLLEPCESSSFCPANVCEPADAGPTLRANLYVLSRVDLLQRHERAAADVMTAFSLFHPHIVTVNDAITTPNFYCLVTEPVHGGTLASYVQSKGNLPERAAKFLFQQLCMVLSFCHARGVYLQHLTPDRIVIDWAPGKLPVLKLADCGFVAGSQIPQAWTLDHAKSVSAWSAGFILYYMLYGCEPPALHGQTVVWRPSAFISAMHDPAFTRNAAPKWIYAENSHGPVCDSTRAAVHQLLCGATTGGIDALVASPWLHADLPAGIAQANAVCSELSDSRHVGPLAAKMRAELMHALMIPASGFSRAARCDSSPAWYIELQAALRTRFQAAVLGAGVAAPLATGQSESSDHAHDREVSPRMSLRQVDESAENGDVRGGSPRHRAATAAAARALDTLTAHQRRSGSATAPGSAKAGSAARADTTLLERASWPRLGVPDTAKREAAPTLKRLSAPSVSGPAAAQPVRKASKRGAEAVRTAQLPRARAVECSAEHTGNSKQVSSTPWAISMA